MQLRPGQLLRHYKTGQHYLVLHLALLHESGSTNLEQVVVYRQLHSGLVFVRHIDEFEEQVPVPFAAAPGQLVQRFTPVREAPELLT